MKLLLPTLRLRHHRKKGTDHYYSQQRRCCNSLASKRLRWHTLTEDQTNAARGGTPPHQTPGTPLLFIVPVSWQLIPSLVSSAAPPNIDGTPKRNPTRDQTSIKSKGAGRGMSARENQTAEGHATQGSRQNFRHAYYSSGRRGNLHQICNTHRRAPKDFRIKSRHKTALEVESAATTVVVGLKAPP